MSRTRTSLRPFPMTAALRVPAENTATVSQNKDRDYQGPTIPGSYANNLLIVAAFFAGFGLGRPGRSARSASARRGFSPPLPTTLRVDRLLVPWRRGVG